MGDDAGDDKRSPDQQKQEPDKKPDEQRGSDEGKGTAQPDEKKGSDEKPAAASEGPTDAQQNPAVLDKVGDPKGKLRNVIFKIPPERKPVWSEIKIQNPSDEQKTFKVKCTSADFFRVQPPLGFIKANETSRIRVWFQNANGIPTDGKKHYFAIYFMNAAQGKTVKELWGKDAKHEGICRINVVFEKKGEAEAKPQ